MNSIMFVFLMRGCVIKIFKVEKTRHKSNAVVDTSRDFLSNHSTPGSEFVFHKDSRLKGCKKRAHFLASRVEYICNTLAASPLFLSFVCFSKYTS